MKILHTADWHLGKRLENQSRHEEQIEVLNEIAQIAAFQNVDLVLIAGDITDSFNPPTESIDLMYKALKKLSNDGKRPVIVIAGNHDSPDRLEAPDPLAKECGILFFGYPFSEPPLFELDNSFRIERKAPGFIELFLPHFTYPVRLLYTPYANEYRLKSYLNKENKEAELRGLLQMHWQNITENYCDNNGVNILMAHLFFGANGQNIEEEPDGERPILHVGGAQIIFPENIPNQIQYVALGHLHRKHFVSESPVPIVYSGSPLAYSFSEAGQTKYVSIVNVEPGQNAKIDFVPLKCGKKLVRVGFDNIDDAVAWLKSNPGTLVELTIVCDHYINTDDKKRLYQAHEGIITIIPKMKTNEMGTEINPYSNIDLSNDIRPLFQQYFKFREGVGPNEEILELFNEILAK